MQQLDRFTNVIFGGWIFTRRSDRFTNVAAPSSQSGHTYSPRQQVTISQTWPSLPGSEFASFQTLIGSSGVLYAS